MVKGKVCPLCNAAVDAFCGANRRASVFRQCAKIFACRSDNSLTLSPQQEVEQTCELLSSWSAPSAKRETTRRPKSENRAEPRSGLNCASIASIVANTLSTERPDSVLSVAGSELWVERSFSFCLNHQLATPDPELKHRKGCRALSTSQGGSLASDAFHRQGRGCDRCQVQPFR